MAPKRLPISTFDLPIHELRRGYRSDIYFWRSKVILEKEKHNPEVLIQAFQKKKAILCGIDEAIAIIKVATGFYKNSTKAYHLFDQLIEIKKEVRSFYSKESDLIIKATQRKLEIQEELENLWDNRFKDLSLKALHDGDSIRPLEPVLSVKGPASYFIHMETLYLGVLARMTKVATNVHQVVKAARGKPVLFFPARFDHWGNQGGDGYAAKIGGASLVSTDAQAAWWGAHGAGTIPHALIACFKGDTALTASKFSKNFPHIDCIALVDFDNDCVKTAIQTANALKDKLYAVRLDTSETMVDFSLQEKLGQFDPTGVCVELVWNVRKALDKNGFNHVKIIVSGGFHFEKIRYFEETKAPVDAYGVGSSLLLGNYNFTADVVIVESKPCSKAGRKYSENNRLKDVG